MTQKDKPGYTPRRYMERKALDFITAHHKKWGYVPSFKDIANHAAKGKARKFSRQWAYWIVQGLIEAGKLKKAGVTKRGYTVV